MDSVSSVEIHFSELEMLLGRRSNDAVSQSGTAKGKIAKRLEAQKLRNYAVFLSFAVQIVKQQFHFLREMVLTLLC